MTGARRGPAIAIAIAAAVAVTGCGADRPRGLAGGPVELIEAPAGADLPTLVAGEGTRARRDGRPLLVYVGAAWCEPCVRFHAAAAGGELDQALPGLRLVVFDADRDDPALRAAGYGSAMIPLFAEVRADGTAGDRRVEGGVAGDGAIAQLVPRVRALLAPPR